MSDRIHVTMELELYVEDAGEMRETAFERLRSAWSSDDDFPYDSSDEVPLDEVVHSLLADALPGELPGCRRSQLAVEVDDQTDDAADSADSEQSAGADSTDEEGSDDSDGAADSEDTDDSEDSEDSDTADSDEDEPPTEDSPSGESSNSDESADDAQDEDDRADK